ncbi:ankyrin repeat-containing protein [Pyrus ussuriensis x Pyrus communis]|uniref:Ankyrin repeat-containing protein n=1 Tax=Pyrus ussuriensis x Pyrus communis TaxID=2448454 RepID=A0A5N5FMS8_9ROSA|nr:ankyrin repeat-containing protein [Pyrus ussuriensis x Pyrus communis]
MDKKLLDAAMAGDTAALKDLIAEDPLVLDRALVSCVSETPLHVASMLGHLAFVTELLSRNPELASELDSHGSTPLHVAAAKGHAEIVKELVLADPGACAVRNGDGRAALHVAAAKGRVKVVRELVRVGSESTRALTDRGETALHLCVGCNRLEGLKVLVEAAGSDDDFVNWKDCDGNTVLHIAVAKKQTEITKFLLFKTGVNVNALNANSATALDILMQSPRDLRDMEIEDSLRGAGAQSAKDVCNIAHDWVRAPTKERQISRHRGSALSSRVSVSMKPAGNKKPTDWLGRKRSSLMVVASLLATVAFQAAITPPGGFWQDDLQVDENGNPVANPHTVGTSVMATKQGKEYGLFMIFNTISFLTSLSIILLLVSGLPIKRRRWMWIQMVIMWVAVTTLVITYFITLRHMSPNDVHVQILLRKVTEISVLTWLTLMVVVFFGNVIRMNLWILRKYGYIKPKEVDDELEEVRTED